MLKVAGDDNPRAVRIGDVEGALNWQNKIVGATLMTGGVAAAYAAIKKLIDDSYRSKLYAALKKNKDVDKAYRQQDADITNEFINGGVEKEGSINKEAWFDWLTGTSPSEADKYVPSSYSKPGLSNDLATIYAKNPRTGSILSALALGAGIPLAWMGGKAAVNAITKPFKASDKASGNDKSVTKAKKEYEEAARTLAKVTHGTKAKKKKKEEDEDRSVEEDTSNVDTSSRDPYAYLSKAGMYKTALQADKEVTLNYEGTQYNGTKSTPISGSVASLIALAAALGVGIGGWRFARGLTKGYKDKEDEISDLTRALQSWDIIRKSRDMDVMSPRVELQETEGSPID